MRRIHHFQRVVSVLVGRGLCHDAAVLVNLDEIGVMQRTFLILHRTSNRAARFHLGILLLGLIGLCRLWRFGGLDGRTVEHGGC